MSTLIEGDCIEAMRAMPEASLDSIVCDPPYGLEFMGKEWDRLDGDAWRTGGGFSKPGIGQRAIEWTSYGAGDTANATCADCGGRMRGAKKCACPEPAWRVKGKALGAAGADSRQAQGRKMQAWHAAWLAEALRVLKPGGHLIAFGGARTHHRLWCAAEDAGFEIRDTLMWVYAAGFPKSLDVSKAIDKAAGAEREVVGPPPYTRGRATGSYSEARRVSYDYPPQPQTAPTTDAARQWEGWGTALKPAQEPILLARKPLVGTVAANVLAHGTGALNIGACRVSYEHDIADPASNPLYRKQAGYKNDNANDAGSSSFTLKDGSGERGPVAAGRFPPNVLLEHVGADPETGEGGCVRDGAKRVRGNPQGAKPEGTRERRSGFALTASTVDYADADGLETVDAWRCVDGCPARALDEQSGELASGVMRAGQQRSTGGGYHGNFPPEATATDTPGDSGGASRFYFCAKASGDDERWFFCQAHALAGPKSLASKHATCGKAVVWHPTVKPVELMRWLLRLVTPKGGAVLDPFAGTGTTGVAARAEGLRATLIERDPDYCAIARGRLGQGPRDGQQVLV